MKKAKMALILLLLLPAFMVSIAAPGAAAAAARRQKGLLDADNDSTAARITKLVFLLKGMSDDEYGRALSDLPAGAASRPELVSRKAALKSAYTTMAALDYKEAEKDAPEDAARHAESYRRVAAQDAQAVGIDPTTMKESGWAGDALKWLANAGINYALQGGTVMVGRSTNSKTAKLEGSLEQLDNEIQGAEGQQRAELRSKRAAVYEQLAADAEPESEADKAAKKKARLKQLAQLLESVSNDEYQEALQAAGPKAAKQPELNKRGKVLKSSYITLAALEYKDAAKGAPGGSADGGAKYAQDYQRVSRDSANLAVNPETLQETGWGSKLLGLAAFGGLGYLVYEQGLRQGKRGGQHSSPPQSAPAECPQGTRLENGKCIGEPSCPEGTTWDGGRCMGKKACPKATEPQGDSCMAPVSCPERTALVNGNCSGEVSCPFETKLDGGRCVAPTVCADGAKPADGRCEGKVVCPPSTQQDGNVCAGTPLCPSHTRWQDGACLGTVTCPDGTTMDGERCVASVTCPKNTKANGELCIAVVTCPPDSDPEGDKCVARLQCPPGGKLEDGRCVPLIWPGPQTGLVGLWHFDEASGAAALDSSGNALNGALVNSPVWGAGKRGWALAFNGSGAYVEVPNTPALNSSLLTVEAWFRPDGMQAYAANVIDKAHGCANGINGWTFEYIVEGDGRLLFGAGDGTAWSSVKSLKPLVDNQWHHIAGTYDGSTVSFYVDGQSQGNAPLATLAKNSGVLRFGNAVPCAPRYFKGSIDEVSLFNVARSPEQILADFKSDDLSALTPPPPSPAPTRPKIATLFDSLSALEGQRVGRSLGTQEDADVHHKMGGVYEQLAAASDDEAANEPAQKPAAAEKPPTSPATEPAAPASKANPAAKASAGQAMEEMKQMQQDLKKVRARKRGAKPTP